jgi:hypothetical protein
MRDRLMSLLLALLAIVVLCAIFFQSEAKIETSMPHSEDRGDQGLASFYHWLQLRGVAVQSNRRRWHELRQGQGHVLLTHAPFRMQEEEKRNWRAAPRAYQEAREVRALRRWVAQGNTLVLAVSLADVDAPEIYMREEERNEAVYLPLLEKFGWSYALDISEMESSLANATAAAQAADADEDEAAYAESDADDETSEEALDEDNDESSDDSISVKREPDHKGYAQAPSGRGKRARQASESSAAFEVKPEPLPLATAQKTPQALHQLTLRLPGQDAPEFALEAMRWNSQFAHTVKFNAVQGNYDDRFCRAVNESDADTSDEDKADKDEESEDASDGEESNNASQDQAASNPAVDAASTQAQTSEPLDFSSDEILADGTTIAANGARLEPYCNTPGLKKAQPLLFSARDQSEQGWWLPFGAGRIVVLAYGGLFRNQSLLKADNARAGEALLQRFLGEGGAVMFDDYRYGLSDVYDPDAFFKDRRLHLTIAIAALLWLMYAVGKRSRMLPLTQPAPRFTSAQLARNLRQFFARKLSPSDIAQLLFEHFERALAQRYVLSIDAAEPQAVRLRRQLTTLRVDKAELDSLLMLVDGSDNELLSRKLAALSERLQLNVFQLDSKHSISFNQEGS